MARTTKASKATKKTAKAKTKKAAAKKKPAAKSSTTKKRSTKSGATQKAPAKSAGRRKKSTTKKSSGTSTASTKNAAAKKATKSTRAKKPRSPFDSRFLEKMRKSLTSEREVYERQAKQLKAEADSLVADLDPGDVQFDEESGEGDTIAVERGRDLALASKALEMIEEIDHALAKFDLGAYGICEISGEPIPKERLEAIPWAREKVEYKVGGFGRR